MDIRKKYWEILNSDVSQDEMLNFFLKASLENLFFNPHLEILELYESENEMRKHKNFLRKTEGQLLNFVFSGKKFTENLFSEDYFYFKILIKKNFKR